MGYEVEVPVQRPRIEQMESRIRSPRRLEPTGQRVAPISKLVTIPYAAFVPTTDTMQWIREFTQGTLAPRAINTLLTCDAAVYLPEGITLESVRARLYRANAGDIAQLITIRVPKDNSGATVLGTLTGDSGGWSTKTLNLSELSNGLNMYTLRCALQGVSVANDARFAWVEIVYSSPQTLVTI